MRDLQTSGSIRARGFTRRWAIRFGRSSFLLLFLLLGPALSFVVAAPGHKSKMAPDLEEETRKGSPSRSVRVVATLEGAYADSVARKVADLGGTVRGHFHQVQEMVLELPLESVEALAATDGVRYLAPDREVSALVSQIDSTTGASLVHPAVVVLDSTSSAPGPGADGTTLTWSHTIGSASGRLLVVGVSLRDGNTSVTGITYGGASLARVGFRNAGGNQNRAEMWELLAPPTGTASVVVTLSAGKRIAAGAVSFFNVDQTTPHGAFASSSGSGTTAWVSLPSATGELVIDMVSANGDATWLFSGLGQRRRWAAFSGNGDAGNARAGGSTEPGAPSVTTWWILGAAKQWSAGAVSLKPAPAAAFSIEGYDGRGVAVAVLDSGIDSGLRDLINPETNASRVILGIDFTGGNRLDDAFGHGSHVAGIIAGDGRGAYALGRDYSGVAPGASLINLRVLDDYGRGYISSVIAAVDYAISVRSRYNIRVLNLSLAAPPIDSYVNDPICQAVDRATSAGIVVVASAGNFGRNPNTDEKAYGSVTSPGISPAAITVGAVDTRGTVFRSDDRIAPFSSRGPTLSHTTDPDTDAVVYDFLAKPDLVAPGTRIVSLERDNNYLVKTYPVLHTDGYLAKNRYMTLSGTSMSAGVVSGAATLILQANPSLTPNMVKAILMYTAQMMDGPDLFEQGAGMLNIDGAVRLARTLRQDAGVLPVGSALADLPLPQPQSMIAGETFAWSQGLIWGFGALRGAAMFTTQQEAYAQSLIWGLRLDVWGAGITYYDGLYSQTNVAFSQNNQWQYVTWDSGTATPSGLIWGHPIYASGVAWQDQVISEDFFDVSSSSLIWGLRGYACYESGLIWGFVNVLVWGIF